MGLCLKTSRRVSDSEALRRCPMYNEHSHIQSFYKVGVVGEKTNDGEVHIGIKAMKTTKKDREYTTVNGKKKEDEFTIPLDTNSENTIPSVLDQRREDGEPSNQLSETPSQKGVT